MGVILNVVSASPEFCQWLFDHGVRWGILPRSSNHVLRNGLGTWTIFLQALNDSMTLNFVHFYGKVSGFITWMIMLWCCNKKIHMQFFVWTLLKGLCSYAPLSTDVAQLLHMGAAIFFTSFHTVFWPCTFWALWRDFFDFLTEFGTFVHSFIWLKCKYLLFFLTVTQYRVRR